MDVAALVGLKTRAGGVGGPDLRAVGAAAAGRGQPAAGRLPPRLRGRLAPARAQSRPVRAQPPALAAAGPAAHRLGRRVLARPAPRLPRRPARARRRHPPARLWIYWWHRANHELPFLWRFHAVHHYDELLDTSSAVRFHFGEVALSALARAGVIVLLDLPLASVVLFEGLVLMAAIFHHSDARLPPAIERPLSRVIVTPSIHWVHHHARRRGYRQQLRHDLQLLGPAVPLAQPHGAHARACRSASRARATGRCSACWSPRSASGRHERRGALDPPVDQGQDHRPAGQEDQEGQPQAVIAEGRHQHGGGDARTGPARPPCRCAARPCGWRRNRCRRTRTPRPTPGAGPRCRAGRPSPARAPRRARSSGARPGRRERRRPGSSATASRAALAKLARTAARKPGRSRAPTVRPTMASAAWAKPSSP